jgi:hypothetical protein
MDESTSKFGKTCYHDCESSFRDCMKSKEHESVCKIKHAQCSCGCVLE